jgi:hypothetical protein
MPRGAAPGERRGGRKRGTPNKRTAFARKVADMVAQGDEETPLEFLLAAMRSEDIPLEQRLEAAKAAAPYVHPRLSAIEHGGSLGVHQMSHEEWLASLT